MPRDSITGSEQLRLHNSTLQARTEETLEVYEGAHDEPE